MVDHRSWVALRGLAWFAAPALVVAIGVGLATAPPDQPGRAQQTWRVLVETGDELAAGQVSATLGGQPLTAGKAYLLAFHEAQDVGDLEHVLAVADRLEAAGEADLAAQVRRAAETLLAEVGG